MCSYFGISGGAYLKTVYAGLYFFPIAAVIHAFLGGVVCKLIKQNSILYFFVFNVNIEY